MALNLRTPNGYDGSRATRTRQGITRLATDAEALAGIANNVAVTPAQLTAGSISPAELTLRLSSPGPIGNTTPSTGAFTTLTSTSTTTLASGAGVAAKLGNSTGTLGFFGATGATKVTQGAITNSVTAGGSTGTIANYTDLTVYANDAAAIRNDIYQLSLALANVVGAMRSYGLLV